LAVDADDPATAVAGAFAAAHDLLIPYPTDPAGAYAAFADVTLADSMGRKEGSFHVVDGVMSRVVDGQLCAAPRPSKELTALVALRDAAVTLIAGRRRRI
jgi:hypothetical protein